ncbi:hypothetical protein IQ07DRAFT_588933 [Pyrenochaeta sp. DS3sAY3a]|nr:hypothetical protein IQ07DRAFT_588933 [Pyrenochaeta sp. DS3sAY3a]
MHASARLCSNVDVFVLNFPLVLFNFVYLCVSLWVPLTTTEMYVCSKGGGWGTLCDCAQGLTVTMTFRVDFGWGTWSLEACGVASEAAHSLSTHGAHGCYCEVKHARMWVMPSVFRVDERHFCTATRVVPWSRSGEIATRVK